MLKNRLCLAVALAGVALTLSSCGRKADDFERAFVQGCAGNGAKLKQCQCTYDAIHEHYGDKRMAELKTGNPPADFTGVLGTSMMKCVGS